jgi:hypothetical protein
MPDIFKASLYWFIAYAVLLGGGFFFFERSLFSDMAVFIGLLAGIIVLYSAKKKDLKKEPSKKRAFFVLLGLLIALSSFANEFLAYAGSGMHFWNPPYSIGEFTVHSSDTRASCSRPDFPRS